MGASNQADVSRDMQEFSMDQQANHLIDPGLWMGGGSQGQARYFSRFVALSICAAVRGMSLDVYRK